MGSNLEKCELFWKNSHFSRRIWPDWGYTTWADLAGLGSIGLRIDNSPFGPFWCGRSTTRTGISLLYAYLHNIYYLEAGFTTYLIV